MRPPIVRVLSAAAIITLAIITLAWLPSAAAGSTNCATVAACVFGINAAGGPGVEGESHSADAVVGISTSGYGVEGVSKTNDGVVGHAAINASSPSTGKAGVSGYDDSTNHKPYNSGVFGVSTYSMGVQGRSTYGPGMLASSYEGNAIVASAGPALYLGFTNAGVVAQSTQGDGMIAIGTTTGIAGFATTGCTVVGCTSPLQNEIPSGAAVTAGTDAGGLGLNVFTDANPGLLPNAPDGVGAVIDSGSVGMMITPDRSSTGQPGLIVNGALAPRDVDSLFQGAIVSGYNAMSVTGDQIGIAVSAASAIVARSTGSGGVLFQGQTSSGTTTSELDDAGNLIIAGKLTQKGTIATALRSADGTYRASYAALSTLPTVEDLGEATLTAGTAFVPIDPALRRAIDVSRGYLVFLTAQGPTTGLYVTGKSAAGFTVREIGSARDSLAFDYRIVAHPYAEPESRLASTSAAIGPANARRALFYRHLKPLRFAHGKLDSTSLPIPSM